MTGREEVTAEVTLIIVVAAVMALTLVRMSNNSNNVSNSSNSRSRNSIGSYLLSQDDEEALEDSHKVNE